MKAVVLDKFEPLGVRVYVDGKDITEEIDVHGSSTFKMTGRFKPSGLWSIETADEIIDHFARDLAGRRPA